MVMWYVFQRKSWKRRFFTLDDNAVNYYKTESVRKQGFHVFGIFLSQIFENYSVIAAKTLKNNPQ